MKRFLIFTLLAICLIGCAEESENPLTSEETTDPDIPTIVETDPDIPTVNVVLAETACPTPNQDWELIATLERNPLKPSHFYVPDGEVEHLPDFTDVINGAFAEGKHFIFVIKKNFSIKHIQFYLLQTSPPVFEKRPAPGGHIHFEFFQWQFPSEPTWYRSTHFGFGKTTDTTYAGLSVEFDLTPDLNNPPKRKYWQPPKFFVSINHHDTNFIIHDGIQLQIYVSR